MVNYNNIYKKMVNINDKKWIKPLEIIVYNLKTKDCNKTLMCDCIICTECPFSSENSISKDMYCIGSDIPINERLGFMNDFIFKIKYSNSYNKLDI